MQAIQERVIDDLKVSVSQFPAGKGWRLFMKINKTILPALSNLVGSIKSWETMDIDKDGLNKAIEVLLMELEPNKSEALIKEILELTTVDGQNAVQGFDLLFQGRYLTLIKIVAFSVEVNYKSFLPEGGLAKLTQVAKEKQSAFQTH